ncbi:SRPBCC family protein [Epilithonimonas hungarica]|uniref:Activator of Hsp90 ATPase homolog 1-like protein n=1 Tax=Epilithonimonas hungarica TaxID=454006 RepID=A0A1G7JPE9_9FLAO|nr:SRPBCC domain-containing protein [Epilithonimonas hungarica]SDF26684.1 Activator of Hsp90 ATPase homolog 1-like protein [Epilithonimonas hungarica]
MEKLKYQIEIDASPEKVWDVLWNEKTYSQWTYYFSPDSNMVTDWEVGGKTYFTDSSRKNGMVSTIERIEEPKHLIFKHLGELHNGVEDVDSEKVKAWNGSLEAYYLEEDNGKTILKVEVDSNDEFKEMFDNGFKKGLEVIKDLSEN